MGGATSFESISISKRIEVQPETGSNYFIELEKAKQLTSSGQARWIGPKKLKLAPDQSKRCKWAAVPSGFNGPTVMQLT